MKVYISGKITGLKLKQAMQNFANAELLLGSAGMTPVNPLNGADQKKSWKQHMVRDVELLLGCEAILLLRNWTDSKGARIEKNIAVECGMKILHETSTNVKEAIYHATGVKYNEYTKESRKRSMLYARMIHANYLFRFEEMSKKEISDIVKRDRSTINYYLSKHEDELNYNPEYKQLNDKILTFLSNTTVSH